MTPAIKSLTSSALGPTRRTSPRAASSPGSASDPANSTIGSCALAKSTNTTPGCHATIGSPMTKRKASASSRASIHWEIREKMEEADVQTIIQRAREAYPGVTPQIISDNGPQFLAKDFKEFIRVCGMTHVKTSPYYPQSNGKIERWHKTLKGDCIRVKVPLSLDDARRIVADYVAHYNNVRLHSAIGYVTPRDKLAGRDREIFAERDRNLAEAR